ncbi:MAG: hypothetical protein WAM98_20200, partial [Terriglobales bacterium]
IAGFERGLGSGRLTARRTLIINMTLLHPWLPGAERTVDLWAQERAKAYNLDRNGPLYPSTCDAFGAPLGD